jgi:predicted dehydrogenase
MKTLAFVGCGHIHTPGFIQNLNRRTATVRVKSVWDHDLPRAERRAAELPGSRVEESLSHLCLDDEIDAAIVCTETNLHEKVVLPLVEAGKHVFVEKPLGFAGADARSMAEAIESKSLLFSTGYFSRGDAQLRFVKKHIEAGSFGKITRARMSNCHSGALGGWFDGEWRWMADPKVAGCGAFGDLGTHVLDILLWFFGDVEKCTAQLDAGTNRYEGCDETGEGMLRFKSGTIATLAAGWDDVADPVRLIVSGTEGHAAIVNGQLYFQSQKIEGMDGTKPLRDAEIGPGAPAGLDAWLDQVTGIGTPDLVGAKEAAYRSTVMEALYRGAKESAWVTV